MSVSAPSVSPRRDVPPGPRGHWLLGVGPAAALDPLRLYVEAWRKYGDVVRLRAIPSFSWYLVTHPRDIEHVLVHNQRNYVKGGFFRRALVPLLGNGLFTNEGDSWLAQRRLIQPAFHRGHVTALADTIVGPTEAIVERWQAIAATGQRVDVLDEMTRLTLQIAGLSLFGADLTGAASGIGAASRVVFEQANHRLNTPFPLPDWVPTSRNRRFVRARHVLDQAVFSIVEQRRREPSPRHDLLALLMDARDESGAGMTDRQLRDEVVTLMLAGHETTAATLAWTWYLLSENPEAAERLASELDSVLAGRTPTVEDLARLPYTEMVILESMRLYPPAWGVPRQSLVEDELGGYRLPAGAMLAIGTHVTHRRPDFWEEPERFDPERFSPERSASRPRFAYLPFGGGARQCVGSSFAMLESRLVLAILAQRFRPRLVPGHPVVPDPTFTLRPRFGLPMTPEARAS
jgi:cytochrome P450